MVHQSVISASFTSAPQITVITLLTAPSVGLITSQTSITRIKAAQPNMPYSDHTSNYEGYPRYKVILKHRIISISLTSSS